MKAKSYLILSKLYLHARPIALLAQTARKFKSTVIIEDDAGHEINAKDPIAILSLCIKENQKIIVRIEGEDEEKAMHSINKLMNLKINLI